MIRNTSRSLLPYALIVLTTVAMFVASWAALIHAPRERTMGAVQRLFYFHVPSALVTYAAVAVLLGGSIAYLWTRRRIFDDLSRAATELGIVFCTIVLISGPIWAKPVWGVWWTWEARLTSTLVLWLLLLGCLMVRSYATDPETGARFAAVLGIVTALDIPIIIKAVEWWRGQHPDVFKPGQKNPLAPEMMQAFGLSVLAFFILFVLFLVVRTRQVSLELKVRQLAELAAERAESQR